MEAFAAPQPQFQVLGPFEVRVHDEVLDLGGPRIRTLLAVLTANAGRVTTVGTMVESLWGPQFPPDAHRTVRSYISRLRRALAVDRLIVTQPAGYVLRLDPHVVDARRFERLVEAGRDALAAGRAANAAEQLSLALTLWRGEAYGEFSATPVLRAEAARLEGLRLGAVEDRVDAELANGAGAALVEELTALTDRHPGRERLWGQLMTALYRAGRQAEALDAFLRARAVLVERFGLDPSPRLSALHQQVLDNDARLFGVPVAATDDPARDDLPGDIPDFAGRGTELALLATARDTGRHAVVIEAIDGMAGVGKTTLAVHAAHRFAEHYHDRLFIDLHGHAPSQRPVSPMAALDALLRALGVPEERIPLEPDARAALWRAELATRSVLVVLDNAADAAQVRPLLPGTSRSLTLITSRRRLVDLDATQVVSLDVLPETDAVALFTSVAGGDGEECSVHEVVALCGHLPLAIRIAAARLRARPAWTVGHLADRLRQAHSPITELEAGDRSVAAAFALSYEHLDEQRQRVFRLLGLHPGPDFGAHAAAALAAVDLPEAGRLLESLVDDHLLQEPAPGRYRFHDLVRQHAHAVALADEPEPLRHKALRRVVDYYLHTAHNGSRLLDQQHPPIALEPADCVPHPLPDGAAAMAWFDANHHCVLAARIAAEDAGWDTVVWQLAWSLDNFHYRRGHLHDNIASWRVGLVAAERLGDLAVQARAHRRLGLVYAPLGRDAEALLHLRRSLSLSEQVGDTLGQAGAHIVLALALTWRKDDHGVLAHLTEARNLYRRTGTTRWEIRALSMMGASYTRLGHHTRARRFCESALALCLRHDDVYGQADSMDGLGAIAGNTGDHDQALRHYTRALGLWRDLDNTYRQAGTLAALGDTRRDLGELDTARQCWQEAIDLYRGQNLHQAADRIARRSG
ncbi:AfsR/SARP family transcriptional regulator [Lentzea sp.]|uniref:AfsR/SARP family transcriptional regulator n=1 Tax=Lentzea sp. TaxID=56099 RepID=UPI002BF7B705|nr:BTAD domain-containing putative transcriptional regulator [Lentzea sp.]HUQ57796.1 BTAD domain-containing putative transcriptional regulator [Lentzea sp.]